MAKQVKVYRYEPSLAAAIIFVVAFSLTSALHTFQLSRTRTWFFIAFAVGGWFEVIGYVGRLVSVNQYPNTTKPPYVINILFPLVAPALYSASIYMALGRIFKITNGAKYSIIRPSWLTKIFVFGDVASFVIVGVGGSLVATADTADKADKGELIVIVGLIVQLVFFSIFLLTALIFHFRINKNPTEKVQVKHTVHYQKHLYILYLAGFLILARSVFKLIEYIQGRDGYLFSKEWFAYVFDAAFMFFTMIIFHIVHPSELNALANGGGLVIYKLVLAKQLDVYE
ncbi:hypothetical protein H072_385 [Dactylellina haptotyla CBS 200.50]|uniref:RTA1 like protein n=1 Tax=Dactylellina haptotyla (strain CBS 200.50) TaxID=1284197 RepID=S8AXB3_DACHA|nr:hypothetical protein H072_385 [Dactylellina haptotyla CBS 200.50]